MRFMRLGEPGSELPVVSDGETAWDLRPLTADIDGAFLAADGLTRAEAAVHTPRTYLGDWRPY